MIEARHVAGLCLLAALTGASLAHAADPPGKAAYDAGSRFYDEGRFAEALPHFEQAYAESGGRPATVRALALCQAALGRYEVAIRLFGEYADKRPEERETIDKTIEVLRQKLAEASVVRPLGEDSTAGRRTAPPIATPLEDSSWDKVAAPPPPPPSSSVATWVVVGSLIAAAVAGGIVGAVMLAAPDAEPPFSGSLGVTLRR